MATRIDSGATHLPLCDCGWRGLPTRDRSGAHRQCIEHERRAHPGDFQAVRAWNNYATRRRNP